MSEIDLEAVTRPNWEFSKFDPELIGDNLSQGWELKRTSLQNARLLAQVSGANFQDEVAQAVQGSADEIIRLSQEVDDYFKPYTYILFAWIAYNFGHGDPSCANFHNWAGLVISGNREAFIKAKTKLLPHLIEYSQNIQKHVHPELIHILETPHQLHYTARRIPEVIYTDNKDEFQIIWPKKDLKKAVGNPPFIIKL